MYMMLCYYIFIDQLNMALYLHFALYSSHVTLFVCGVRQNYSHFKHLVHVALFKVYSGLENKYLEQTEFGPSSWEEVLKQSIILPSTYSFGLENAIMPCTWI